MEMEVAMMPAAATVDFNFDSNCSSPYMTAPSTPQRFGNSSIFFSAPASPTRISAFYRELNDEHSYLAQFNDQVVEEGMSRKNDDDDDDDDDDDFEFNFSGQLERSSLSAADELFDSGKIRPLKPPITGYDSESAPFEQRGRERVSESRSRKGTRSLSPIRVSDILLDEQEDDNSQASRIMDNNNNINNNSSKSFASSILSAISFSNKKWKLKDLLLFRSASEGRATSPDPLSKYAVLTTKKESTVVVEDVKNYSSSFIRSTESSAGSVSRRRRTAVSAHELHYTANRAVSEELKRKTYLPYKQGLLGGCLRFNPSGSVHEISRRVGSLPRG